MQTGPETPLRFTCEERIMKANQFIAAILAVCCVITLLAGCEEQAARPRRMDPSWFRQFDMPVEQPPAGPIQPPVAQTAKQPEPKLTFEKSVHDFGEVGLKTEKLCEFTFTNTGDAVLSITGITKSCGACTAFQLDKVDYAPGESGTLKVKFYSDTQPGQIVKNLTIHSNDPTNPDFDIAVTAKVLSKVEFEPKELTLLLRQANAACPKITLTSTDGQPFSISYFKPSADCISIDYDPTVKAMQFVIEPKIDMSRLAQNLDGRIEIGLTHPECPTVTLDVKTIPMYRFNRILARGVQPGELVVKKVRIISNYGENFAIESVSSENGTATVLGTQSIGNGYELEVEITPPLDNNQRIFTETLIVTTGNGDKVEIPCTLFFVGTEPKPTAKQSEKECKICGPRVIYRAGVSGRDF